MKDLFGWETWGLAVLIEASGLPELNVKNKELMSKYKKNMDEGLINHPQIFIEYSMNDVTVLFDIVEMKISTFNEILTGVFGITDTNALFTIFNIPMTLGRLVFETWHRYLNYVIFKNDDVYKIASFKLAILNPLHPHYQDNLHYFKKLCAFKSLNEIYLFKDSNRSEFIDMKKCLMAPKAFSYKCYEYCSIKYLLDNSINNNSFLLAMTSGGRTVNERPRECLIEYGADVDILSAYGTILLDTLYPFGRPRIYSNTNNTTDFMTLGEFMKKYETKMQKNKMFKILVSGELSFQQDLLHSKIPSFESVKNKIKNFSNLEEGQQAILTQFHLLRKQISNSSITYNTWDLLRKVCTNVELKEIKNLKVEAALYYLDEDSCDNIESFLEEMLKNEGKYEFSKKYSSVLDTRTFKYYFFPIQKFVGPLLTKRIELKKQKKDSKAQAISHSLKNIINTLWGDMTSVFFEINNVLASEIVTNTIRNSVWLISKAFNTHMSITDGGPYSLMKVSFLQKNHKKPGLNLLSSYYNYSKHRSIKINPLGGINWKELLLNNKSPYTEPFNNLDKMAQDHIEKFWAFYGLKINFNLEHKIQRTFVRSAYMNKAHYIMLIYNEETSCYDSKCTVIRGFRINDDEEDQYPVYSLLNFIIDNKDPKNDLFEIKKQGFYSTQKLLKLTGWRASLVQKKGKYYESSYGADKLPGDPIKIYRQYRLNNSHCHIDFYKENTRRTRRTMRYTNETIEINDETIKIKNKCFEKYLPSKGVAYTLKQMNKDDLSTKDHTV
ncbi:MAG: hypothetical protein JO131_03230 [Gammaproteobacteria bacterium]|nr:hypothetical protein [Gammaproteobacteria bacterium]